MDSSVKTAPIEDTEMPIKHREDTPTGHQVLSGETDLKKQEKSNTNTHNVKCIISEGRNYIVHKGVFMKLAKVQSHKQCKLGKTTVNMADLVGHPVGAQFRVQPVPGQRLMRAHCVQTADDLADTIAAEESAPDNRHLVGDQGSQSLTRENIQAMQDRGDTGKQIVSSIVDNSASFQGKTGYSQAKYVRKKQRKHFEFISVHEPSVRLVAKMFYMQDPIKIMNMRLDSLSQLLAWAGVRAGGRYLLLETGCQALVTAALLERLAGRGRLLHVHQGGGQPQRQAVDVLNLSHEERACLWTLDLSSLTARFPPPGRAGPPTPAQNGAPPPDAGQTSTAGQSTEGAAAEPTAAVSSVSVALHIESAESETPSTDVSAVAPPTDAGTMAAPSTDISAVAPPTDAGTMAAPSTDVSALASPTDAGAMAAPSADVSAVAPSTDASTMGAPSTDVSAVAPCTDASTMAVPSTDAGATAAPSKEAPASSADSVVAPGMSSGELLHKDSSDTSQQEAEDNSRKRRRSNEMERNAKKAKLVDAARHETSAALQLLEARDMDALIVCCRQHPTNLLSYLTEFVADSRPFVVFCPYKEPLLECYFAMKTKGYIMLKVTETWLRNYQVLPERTHPEINMSGGGGYLLSGIKVTRSISRPAGTVSGSGRA